MTPYILALALLAQTPDGRWEKVLTEPVYEGTTASAPIPVKWHVQNEGSRVGGAGLCVIASGLAAAAYHNVGDGRKLKGSRLWVEANKQTGGYYPEKLDRLIKRIDPTGKFYPIVQDTQADSSTLDKWSRDGRAFGVTMNGGVNYGRQRIAHMVTGVHYRQGDLACIVDNNFPGKYSWMPAAELDRRRDGWAYYWDTPVVRAVRWAAWWPVYIALAVLGLKALRPATVQP